SESAATPLPASRSSSRGEITAFGEFRRRSLIGAPTCAGYPAVALVPAALAEWAWGGGGVGSPFSGTCGAAGVGRGGQRLARRRMGDAGIGGCEGLGGSLLELHFLELLAKLPRQARPLPTQWPT